MADFDTVVIGAGTCGLACAAELAGLGSLLLVEKEPGIGRGASSRNSEVLHAGLYYPPGSLKDRLCREGAETIRRWAAEGHVPLSACGKLVLAPSAADLPRLETLAANARACGVIHLESLSGTEVEEREPAVTCHGALWSPDTAVFDSHALMSHQFNRAQLAGAESVFGNTLVAVRRAGQEYVLTLQNGTEKVETSCRTVVNAAGLYSDAVAALAGIDVLQAGLRLHWNRGEYFAWRPDRRPVIRHLLYPMPGEVDGHLGVHLTIDLGGDVRFGPTSSPVTENHEHYEQDRSGRTAVAAAVSRWLPMVEEQDLEPCLVGLRARLTAPGSVARDFYIREESGRRLPGWVNLIGVESPGLTASPAIGVHVRNLLAHHPG